jgi:hypothetical protein
MAIQPYIRLTRHELFSMPYINSNLSFPVQPIPKSNATTSSAVADVAQAAVPNAPKGKSAEISMREIAIAVGLGLAIGYAAYRITNYYDSKKKAKEITAV